MEKSQSSTMKGSILKLLVILMLLVMALSIMQCLLMYMHCTVGKQQVITQYSEGSIQFQRSNDVALVPTAKGKRKVTVPKKVSKQPIKTDDPTSRQIQRQQHLRDYCRKSRSKQQLKRNHPMATQLFYSDNKKVLYCSVPKVACTNWKRLLLVFDGRMKGLFDIKDKNKVHTMKYTRFVSLNASERQWRQNSFYSFMFVRHPFERLFSAYRNKLMQPTNPQFQRRYGSTILKMFRKNLTRSQYKEGKKVTFEEFLKYIIVVNRTHGFKHFDEHWQIMTKQCSPCSMKYDFIGKMETLHSDANEVLRQLQLDKKYNFPVNATDNYKQKAGTLMKSFYAEVPKLVLQLIHKIYIDDFEAFGYSTNDFF